MGSRIIDMTGQKFGKLTVIKISDERTKCGEIKWECKCDCGKTTFVTRRNIGRGTVSCGCYRDGKISKVNYKHGLSNTRLYKIWADMKKRCYNPKNKRYSCYGGRGITVCEEWLNDFESFYEWSIENGYSKELTLDRIDVNDNYHPDNCRWATKLEQANNTRTNRFIEYNGQTKTLAEWARWAGVNYKLLHRRLQRGWDTGKALGVA